jgi:hypothetical protein
MAARTKPASRKVVKRPTPRRDDVRLADYNNGFLAHQQGQPFEFNQNIAWRRGWYEADLAEELAEA